MEIISHRGYWLKEGEKNSITSFERSFSKGFGTETDIRDFNGRLVISHDIPNENSLSIDDFFRLYERESNSLLALNIKSDGLQTILKSILEKFGIRNYFVFDMSIPDTIGYINAGVRFFSRQSEYELEPIFYEKAQGIWLDNFISEWYDLNLVLNHIANGKKVAIVSSELHGRNQLNLWSFIKSNGLHKEKDVILCSDLPELALRYFNK